MSSPRLLTALRSVICLTMLLLVCLATPALAEEQILSYSSDISVHVDASMTVTESIRVRSEQNRIRHGIYRDFPTTYKTPAGVTKVRFDVLDVRRDGQAEPYHIQSLSNGKRVYIGNKDRILPPGEYSYTIRYRTDRQLGFFGNRDELYWNVTGNGWIFPIDTVTARVRLPDGIAISNDSLKAYTGYQGQRGRDYRSRVDADGTAVFETTRPLHATEGLTIVVTWPAGVIARPSRVQKARWFLRDNTGILFGTGGALVVLIYYFLAWMRVGRDPAAGVIIPRYEPPKDFSPAAVRYVRRMGYDSRAFASAVIDMAVKGYLTIDEDKKVYTLTRRTGADDAALSPGERKIVSKLFGGRNEIVLEKENHSSVRAAINAHRTTLRNEYHKAYFRTNGWLLLPGVLVSLVVLLVAGFETSPESASLVFLCFWLAGWTFTVFMLIRQGQKFMAAMFLLFEVLAIVAVIDLATYQFVLLLLALIVVNVLFYYLIKAPTDAGRKLLDEIEGLKMYMEVAEKDRLNLLNPPELTPQHFEKLLPYALALGVDQRWSEQFAAHLASQGRSAAQYQPVWYRGAGWPGFSTGGFSSSLGASLSSAVSASSTAPGSSSGFGGGGSSGGGGGGGGGGGW
ncbi:MAG: DUF2207 domain-containing protein [Arenicellales bacterium]